MHGADLVLVRVPVTLALAGVLVSGCSDDATPAVTAEESSSGSESSSTIAPTTAPESTVAPESSSFDPSESSSSSAGESSSGEGESSSGGETCGNGAVDADEACDGDELDGQDCASQGFDDGTLACAADCSFDDSACVMYSCGNDMQEGDEVCDGEDIVAQDCTDHGFVGGALACAKNCGGFDTTECLSSVCSNDMQEDEEVCDGDDLAGASCISQGFDGGALACADACDGYVTDGCHECGDGVIGGPEACDGDALGGEDCASQNFDEGTLACAPDCTFDTSACSGACVPGPVEVEFESNGDFISQGDGWQAFTADTDGDIVQVDFYWNLAGTNDEFTMNIYEGGGNGGTLLHSQEFPGQGMGVFVGFDVNVLSIPVPIEAGSVYTVEGVDTFGWQTANGGVPGGTSSFGVGQHKNIRVSIEYSL